MTGAKIKGRYMRQYDKGVEYWIYKFINWREVKKAKLDRFVEDYKEISLGNGFICGEPQIDSNGDLVIRADKINGNVRVLS